jgi:3-dehydroquinate dehydratase
MPLDVDSRLDALEARVDQHEIELNILALYGPNMLAAVREARDGDDIPSELTEAINAIERARRPR